MNSDLSICPKAARDRFFAEEFGGETVVFDAVNRKACSLNGTAAFVWRQCDGRTSLEEIGKRVSLAFDVDEGRDITALAIVELRDNGMMFENGFGQVFDRSYTRRDLLAKVASLGMLAPVIAIAQTKPPKKHRSFVPKRNQQGGSDF